MTHPFVTAEELKARLSPHTRTIEKRAGTAAMLCTEYGARIMGLFPDAEKPNVLWTPPHVDALMREKSWLVGGERLWISPERDFYFENPRDFENHVTPPDMDPGHYRMSEELVFENHFSLLNRATNQTFDNCSARREFTLIDDPYDTGLAFCGVGIEDTMRIPSPEVTMGCWSLSQVYICGVAHPGTGLFPVTQDAEIIDYFDPIPEDRVAVMDGYARYRMDANGIYKLGIAPEHMDFSNICKAVYISPYPNADAWFCVIKRCDTMPRSQQECIDPAKSDPEKPKGAIQSFNSEPGAFGDIEMPFGELELQMQKGSVIDGVTESKGIHELLGYAGTKEEILALAARVLNLSQTPEIYS
jgi:hypothetical protein